MYVVARSSAGDPSGLASAMRAAVREVDPEQPVYNVRTMQEVFSRSVAQRRFSMFLLSIFAGVALLLAAIGLYGMMAYTVTQRTHEIGIRMALGAQRGEILRMVVGQGLVLAVVGVGIGLVGAVAATRMMSSLLYGVSAADPLTYAGVSLLLIAVTVFACYIPARRATKVNPMIALRYE
jgi:putative ABC transport system permease protein